MILAQWMGAVREVVPVGRRTVTVSASTEASISKWSLGVGGDTAAKAEESIPDLGEYLRSKLKRSGEVVDFGHFAGCIDRQSARSRRWAGASEDSGMQMSFSLRQHIYYRSFILDENILPRREVRAERPAVGVLVVREQIQW